MGKEVIRIRNVKEERKRKQQLAEMMQRIKQLEAAVFGQDKGAFAAEQVKDEQ